jgi:hypothetical protein
VRRGALRFALLAALVLAALFAPVPGSPTTGTAQAADLSTFDPGNIISDAVFYDALSMSASSIQDFLDAKGAYCTSASGGSACLKDFSQDTADRSSDAYCSGYDGTAGETAATIIAKVARSCGVNPRVLLVIMQKEQGLVSTTSPTSGRYRSAMGFGCPDTAACDAQYYGFQNQVYSSARQYQRYRVLATSYSYLAGRTNTISYYPAVLNSYGDNRNNARCGTAQVYIENQATAGLYNYTPYVPNQAALDAGYGTGNTCSSYGNRNFFQYFTDWFGSTQSSSATAIFDKYNALGGSSGFLGAVTSGYQCGLVGKGCFQNYEGGSIYYSPATGAHFVRGEIAGLWGRNGWETGALGYPISDESCGLVDDGCYQRFQYKATRVYWSPATGAQFVRAAIRTKYAALGNENGRLGYPTSSETCGLARSGCTQRFQGGALYWSPGTSAHALGGAIFTAWKASGWERGPLGYPVGEENCGLSGGGCYQKFQYDNSRIYWSPTAGAHVIRGAILDEWWSLGAHRTGLAYPTGNETCGLVGGGCYQDFQNGHIYSSPKGGVHAVSGAIFDYWGDRGWETGKLGYPTADAKTTSTGASQRFQGGTVSWDEKTGTVSQS